MKEKFTVFFLQKARETFEKVKFQSTKKIKRAKKL